MYVSPSVPLTVSKTVTECPVCNLTRSPDTYKRLSPFLVEGVNTWDELYIPSVPTLIKVSTQNNLRSAILLESSASKVQNRIYEFLVDKNDYSSLMQPFKIVYNLDGGLFDEMVNNITDNLEDRIENDKEN